ncbi:TraR/DksA C4-type zinc finger protein [Verrucomicrobium sp. BvORR106]|uniref:TraR/DksA C4-type zinc finger protein n=1 Tax=Verrucomicrobium sp. BvORR106 TaxID=1403819 RepID=UPI002240F38D|nr:TraR/DksA C4-type zinc finger protein [Verrucomicrobium sp. BvORR106]
MATKPSKNTAADAKDGAKSAPASKAATNNKQEPGVKAPPEKKKSASVASKGTPAPQPSKKPAESKVKQSPSAGIPVPSSVKKTATPKTEKATAPASKAKEAKAPEKKAAVKAEGAEDEPAPAPKAVKAKVEAPAPKDEAAPAPAPKAAKPKSSKTSAPLAAPAPASKPVPPPKIKKSILDSAPEVVIKQAYNPTKLPPFIKKQQQRLIELRSALLDSMDIVAKDSLRNRPEGSEASVGGMHMADAGSDAYDRDFALSMLSKEQDALYEINEALDRVGQGVYGVCELSGEKINDERLEALPYTRYTREMQELIERDQMGGRLRRAPVRSVFGLEEDGEEGEDGEDEDRPANNNQNESSLDFMKE